MAYSSEKSYGYLLGKIHLDKYHGFPFPAGIDIFALDYIAPDPQEEDFRKNLIEMVLSAYIFINEENQYSAESRRIVSRIEELLHITFKRTEPLRGADFLTG